jgi:hypothetical protein
MHTHIQLHNNTYTHYQASNAHIHRCRDMSYKSINIYLLTHMCMHVQGSIQHMCMHVQETIQHMYVSMYVCTPANYNHIYIRTYMHVHTQQRARKDEDEPVLSSDKAIQWLQRSSDFNISSALYALAKCYGTGFIVEEVCGIPCVCIYVYTQVQYFCIC